MRLFERVSRLIRSDAHGIVEQLEERSLLLKQHLRDAEIAVADARVRAEELEEQQRRLREESERLQQRERALDEDVELALAGGKRDLARFAVARLLPVREARREGQARIAEVAAERERIAERLHDQEARLAELRTRVQARLAAQPAQGRAERVCERRVADEEIELELLRRQGGADAGAAQAGGEA
jgi:phage shock protein A